jgi:uncharacterized protein Yka (UPF0111/DUF47 family)
MAKPKYKSRATRCSEACGKIESATETIRDTAEAFLELVKDFEPVIIDGEEFFTKEDSEKIAEEIGVRNDPLCGAFSQIEEAASEIADLADEMVNWRDNMSGTNLESTDKYSRVEEAADALESVQPDDISEPAEPKPSETGQYSAISITEYIDELNQIADDAESANDDLDSVEFPGMFG